MFTPFVKEILYCRNYDYYFTKYLVEVQTQRNMGYIMVPSKMIWKCDLTAYQLGSYSIVFAGDFVL